MIYMNETLNEKRKNRMITRKRALLFRFAYFGVGVGVGVGDGDGDGDGDGIGSISSTLANNPR